MKKVTNKKGFTLAELLIVVAIIAVLVAIAIPVFGTAMDKAQLAADAATIRANLAETIVTKMTADDYAGKIEITQVEILKGVTKSTATPDDTKKELTVALKTGTAKVIVIPYDTDVTIAAAG